MTRNLAAWRLSRIYGVRYSPYLSIRRASTSAVSCLEPFTSQDGILHLGERCSSKAGLRPFHTVESVQLTADWKHDEYISRKTPTVSLRLSFRTSHSF